MLLGCAAVAYGRIQNEGFESRFTNSIGKVVEASKDFVVKIVDLA